ncbi:chemotaxis protein CheW [Glaciecola sp. MH2013]|uniref:chemotaxis protein CheW n=1 Tax=Glaciecola sp. MH2013 TaxID=2785524 RepID=UPI00189EC932|nr:chemotaxis protein CheW [Glaciecola sp. MH2013]MBF7072394.1 chemotaxis protein CheW [Glaciecola sp. MH2013]
MKDKNEFAKESVVEDYLNDLLLDSDTDESHETRAQKLLDRAAASLVETSINTDANIHTKEDTQTETEHRLNESNDSADEFVEDEYKEITAQVDIDTSKVEFVAPLSMKDSLAERFQALFFEVAGLTLAVPLIELGGIHQIAKVSPMIGKPDWFMGVMIKNDDKFNVVDSAKWVMPEKCTNELLDSLDYQFLINLGKTEWGLACEKLVNTVELEKSDVQWREHTGKRPWLAGMVKEKMCALINVSELVQMLQSGAGSND